MSQAPPEPLSIANMQAYVAIIRKTWTTDTVYKINRSSAARSGGLAAPDLAAPPMFVYTIYCEATTHSALLETGIREIKTGHRDVTFDQKTRFLNLSSIHARTTMLPKSLQEVV